MEKHTHQQPSFGIDSKQDQVYDLTISLQQSPERSEEIVPNAETIERKAQTTSEELDFEQAMETIGAIKRSAEELRDNFNRRNISSAADFISAKRTHGSGSSS